MRTSLLYSDSHDLSGGTYVRTEEGTRFKVLGVTVRLGGKTVHVNLTEQIPYIPTDFGVNAYCRKVRVEGGWTCEEARFSTVTPIGKEATYYLLLNKTTREPQEFTVVTGKEMPWSPKPLFSQSS